MTAKKSGFVDPMALRKELADRTGAQPLKIEPETPAQGFQELLEREQLPTSTPASTNVAKAPSKKDSMPWDNCHPKVKIHFGLRMTDRLHKQFEYAANHTLGDSMQSFALRALDDAVHKRLKELGVI